MGHVLVTLSACLLTVAIAGSLLFLGHKIYERQKLKNEVRDLVASLANRTPAELEREAADLKARPRWARYVLPALAGSIRTPGHEDRQYAAIQIAREFTDNDQVRSSLLAIATHPHAGAYLAGAATEALGNVRPPEKAAGMLRRCLGPEDSDSPPASVLDAVCLGLYRLGPAGLEAMRQVQGRLTPARRDWLAGFVRQSGGPQHEEWLAMLQTDPPATR